LAAPEKQYILRDAGCSLLIAPPEVAAQIGSGSEKSVRAVELDEWRSMVAAASTDPVDVEVDPFDPAAIAYTSGTTGVPKGAVHSQHNLLVYGAGAREAGLYGSDLHAGVQLPLTILNLFVIQVLHAFQNNGKCVCLNVKNAREFADVVRTEKVAHIATVPTIYHDLLQDRDVHPEDLSSVRLAEIGGTSVPTELLHTFRSRFGVEPRVSYGMTEAPAAVTRLPEGQDPTPGLAGLPLPQVSISIRDGQGQPVGPGIEGEIWIGPAPEGPMAHVYTPTLGYWNRPEATAKILVNGWYRTGDLGVVDEAGQLTIRGRDSDLIIRGGANVHPAEVERVLDRIEGVRASAVLGIPDDRLGQRVVAVVETEATVSISEDELRARCGEELARYKVPDRIVLTDQLPRNAMQKIMKGKLRAFFP
jgi:acyl-CoA synthetase (AMP-forming)/AMP-acid ligase II